ncbi:hypothetical protein BDR07DRAFT_74024 [Suillus spraguei]|nr:hypothetical protein BDR07DRAFT_74024 [Suillus spraguei]
MHQCMEMWTRQGHDERITRHRLVCSINAESLSFANLKKHNNLQDGMAAKIFLGEASRTSKPESWTRRSQSMANLSRMMLLKRQRMMADSEHVKDNGKSDVCASCRPCTLSGRDGHLKHLSDDREMLFVVRMGN